MVSVHGEVSPGFERVAEAFQGLFSSYHEMGAGVCVYHHGECVVDLWAGTRDKAATLDWQSETRTNIFSASKALVAISVLQLVADGRLDLDQPIAELWPEFASNGKAGITVRQVLSHRSGISAFHPKIDDNAIYDWQKITAAVAAEEPWWEPGAKQGYSPMLYGWVLGELVRRASGCNSFNEYFQARIAEPLGLSCAFGLGDDELDQVADVVAMGAAQTHTGGSLVDVIRSNPRGVTNRAFSNPMSLMVGTNSPAWRQAQIPAANGQATARDLASFYSSLTNGDDESLLPKAGRSDLWQEQTQAVDEVLQSPLSFSLGFMRLLPRKVTSDQYFCHPGAGGSLGYGDASEGIGFGFVSRVMGQAILMDERAEHLLQAVYSAIRGA